MYIGQLPLKLSANLTLVKLHTFQSLQHRHYPCHLLPVSLISLWWRNGTDNWESQHCIFFSLSAAAKYVNIWGGHLIATLKLIFTSTLSASVGISKDQVWSQWPCHFPELYKLKQINYLTIKGIKNVESKTCISFNKT